MKSGNYDEWIARFFAGTASREEISVLKTAGLITWEDEQYAAALRQQRAQKMDWSFDAFMEEAKPAKVIVLPKSTRRVARFAAAAAVAAAVLLVSAYLFWPAPQASRQLAASSVTKQASAAEQNDDTRSIVARPTAETAPVKKPASVGQATSKKAVQVARNVEKVSSATVAGSLPVAAPFLVMVNGKPITDSEEAIAIAGKSMALFSKSLTQTMEELKPIAQIKIQF